MTGPEHYRDAENSLNCAIRASDRGRDEDAAFWQRDAQAHATLALAAATALRGSLPTADYRAWLDAASAYKPPVPLNGDPS